MLLRISSTNTKSPRCPHKVPNNLRILETTFSEFVQGDAQCQHVLAKEANTMFYVYNKFHADGAGYGTKCFTTLEKGIKFFLKEVAYDRRTFPEYRNIQVVMPGGGPSA